ncbi:MAG: SLC13/DASS family transporter [Leptospiraceae bacterium]|nr:SLC13/DASS family transporter [Leptospiraceae bacterium]
MQFWRKLPAKIGLASGPLAFLLLYTLLAPSPDSASTTGAMAGIALWMAIWWVTEAVPLAVTALLPLVLYPVTGIAATKAIAPAYFNSIIFLFVGGILIALAMERWGLHRRIALRLISVFGSRPPGLLAGFMTAAAFLSMWISNTATAVMMLPIGLAILSRLESALEAEQLPKLQLALLLGIAYSCSVGGMATPIGTPPNMAFMQIYAIQFPEAPLISFGEWLFFAAPLTLFLQLGIWLYLWGALLQFKGAHVLRSDVIRQELQTLGPVSRSEWLVLLVFAATGLLWTFRKDIHIAEFGVHVTGWSALVPFGQSVDDGTIAILGAVLLFLLPGESVAGESAGRLLDARSLRRIPWGIILLFGGGFALADGFGRAGLTEALSTAFAGAGRIPDWLLVFVICIAVSFLTELTSNTALTQVVLPVIAALAAARGLAPLLIMIPATLSASCAFMMPVATPPNAIVFGSEKIRIADMARTGLILNLVCAIFITLYSLLTKDLFF